jgi:hypothetical protein
MERNRRFGLQLSSEEQTALRGLAEKERLSMADTVRRLIWTAATRRGIVHPDGGGFRLPKRSDNDTSHTEAGI